MPNTKGKGGKKKDEEKIYPLNLKLTYLTNFNFLDMLLKY